MTPLDSLCTTAFHDLPAADRARVLNRLADTELYVALDGDPVGDRAKLRLFDLDGGHLAIAADEDGRLAGFFGSPTAHLCLPGRAVAAMLAPEGVSLMVNPGAPSEMLLDPGVLSWLAEALAQAPAEDQAGPARLSSPLPEMVTALAEPLATRLSDMAGLADAVALVAAVWPDDRTAHLLVLSGVAEGERARIAKSLGELLAFLPPLPQPCDIAFDLPLPAGALILRLDPVEVAPEQSPAPRAPGSDPDKPPILRF